MWRPGDAGSADGSLSAGATSDGGTTSSGSNESNDAVSIINSHFSAFASKAMNGMLTGKWDNDFSNLTSTGTSSGSDSSASSGSDASAANIKGSNTAEKVKLVEQYFLDNYSYSMSPGTTPRNEDFIQYFLTNQRMAWREKVFLGFRV